MNESIIQRKSTSSMGQATLVSVSTTPTPTSTCTKHGSPLHMSYSLAWALTSIPFYILHYCISNKATGILMAILTPLEGLYNLIVYMLPKVRTARNTKRVKLPWRQAIAKAWMSKGEKDRAIVIVGRRQSIAGFMRQRFQNI